MLPKISILIVGLVRLFLSEKIYRPFLNRGKRDGRFRRKLVPRLPTLTKEPSRKLLFRMTAELS